MKTVILADCSNAFEANLIKGRLESEGIPCILTNETMSGYPPTEGVQILVSDADLDEAKAIISDASSQD